MSTLQKIIESSKLLRNYIPDRLFAESNLPQVKVVLDGKVIAVEDASLVVSSSGYIPGKPTYRALPTTGTFIPLDNSRFDENIRPIITRISYNDRKLYEPSPGYPSRYSIDEIEIPDEYKYLLYLLKEVLKTDYLPIEFYALSKINPLRFRCPASKKKRISLDNTHWLFFSRARTNVEVTNNISFSHSFYAYLDRSNSFPRFSIYNPQGLIKPIKQYNICGILDAEIYTVKNAFYGIYAVDVYAVLKGKYVVGDSKGGWCRYTIKSSDIKTPRDNTSSTSMYCISTKNGCRYSNYFVKIFVDGDHNNWNPVILGYEIKNTRMLTLDIKDLIRKIASSIVNIGEVEQGQDLKLDYEYKTLSTNTAVVNLLRHYLSHDLVITYYLTRLGFTKIDKYVNLSILINDLFLGNKLTVKLEKDDVKDLASDIINDFIKSFDKEIRQSWISLLRYVLSTVKGERLETYRIFRECKNNKNTQRYCIPHEEAENIWNNIEKRIEGILKNYSEIPSYFGVRTTYWYVGAIIDIIKHTLSHHLIRTISTRYSVNPSKLIEYYYEMRGDAKVSIMERDSGGIGVLNVAFESWEKSDKELRERQVAIEDLILSLGKCLVGTPEDLLHFALLNDDIRERLCSGKDNDVREGIREIIRRLNIIVTPDEFEETIKLWKSIYEEADRLTRILRNGNNYLGNEPCKLLRAVHELRHELEKKMRRFPDMDELMAYMLENIDEYSILNDLLTKMLERGLRTSGRFREFLHELYGTNDYVKRFIGGVNFILRSRIQDIDHLKELVRNSNDIVSKYGTKALEKITECVGKRRDGDDTCKAVIHALKLLGRALRAVLMRISLLSCNGACGMCYVNTKSCSRFGAPFIQARTLDRRVLKVLASELVRHMSDIVRDYYGVNKDVDVIVELGGEPRTLRCE
ncbi:hypothetical protein [Vulcanisaeta distributa]|uniref:Uncharacterized protein n=1 Tax=Vulcanisaeta distributa (strain DSM 14429 / JCM 11212 / NBRC 100878 / IC-017) TaxID=572478 RepID=E1QSS5_VULDI|nr:hypothetical protein [Vulcanisaeta distributa]ADN49592.1 hypothetical protein Vdis_0179 [Vulcanisaeta distributa DSM 14429]